MDIGFRIKKIGMFLEVRHLNVPEIKADEFKYDEDDVTE